MRRCYQGPKLILILVLLAFCLPTIAAKKAGYATASFEKYVEIPGASPVGMEACTACHTDIAKDFVMRFMPNKGLSASNAMAPAACTWMVAEMFRKSSPFRDDLRLMRTAFA